jgi:hypothetical protein
VHDPLCLSWLQGKDQINHGLHGPHPDIQLDGVEILAMAESGSYKYLGLRLTFKWYCCRGLEETLRDQLSKL